MKLKISQSVLISALLVSHSADSSTAIPSDQHLRSLDTLAPIKVSNSMSYRPLGTSYWKVFEINGNTLCSDYQKEELLDLYSYSYEAKSSFELWNIRFDSWGNPHKSHSSTWSALKLYSPPDNDEEVLLNTSEYAQLTGAHVICNNRGYTPEPPFVSGLDIKLDGILFTQNSDNDVATSEISIETFASYQSHQRGPKFSSHIDFIRNEKAYSISATIRYIDMYDGEWKVLSSVNSTLGPSTGYFRLPSGSRPTHSLDWYRSYGMTLLEFERFKVEGSLPYSTVVKIEYEVSNPEGETDIFIHDVELAAEECVANVSPQSEDDICL